MKLMTDHPGGISITSQNGLRIAGGKAYIRYAVDGSRIRQVEIPLDGGDACQSSISDLHGNGQQMRFTHRTDGLELTYRLNLYQDQPFILFHLSVRNLGRQAIYLHDLVLLEANPASGGQARVLFA